MLNFTARVFWGGVGRGRQRGDYEERCQNLSTCPFLAAPTQNPLSHPLSHLPEQHGLVQAMNLQCGYP